MKNLVVLFTMLIVSTVAFADPLPCSLIDMRRGAWVIMRDGDRFSGENVLSEAAAILVSHVRSGICTVTAEKCDVRKLDQDVHAVYRGPFQIAWTPYEQRSYEILYKLVEVGLCR